VEIRHNRRSNKEFTLKLIPSSHRYLTIYSGVLTLVFVMTTAMQVAKSDTKNTFDEITVKKINIVEANGTLRAVLSSSEGFNTGERARNGPVRFAGLMFYNEEGQETGGLVFRGRTIAGGQDADLTLTFDQFRQDQNIYLNHEEFKDAKGMRIDDGLSINARPDFTALAEEVRVYQALQKLAPDKRDEALLKAAQEGKVSSRRVFLGVRRGTEGNKSYDDAGVFIKNKWGRDAMKIYVDNNNKPHFEVYDELGKAIVYELKVEGK
jgi:hypothetical protein